MSTKQTTERNLIAEAKEALITTPKATKEDSSLIEATDPILANELLARRLSLVEQIKLLTAEKVEIENIIKDAIGKKDSLTIHGAKVATISRWRETRVLTDVVREMLPVLDYPELYKRESKSKLTVH
jgi:predicted phage-related endonuclease